MKKGMTIFHVIGFLSFVLLVGLGAFFVNLLLNLSTEERGIKQQSIIEGINIMELLKKNLQPALQYSYYQASYEVAKNGGSLEAPLTWRNYGDITGFPSNFVETLADRTRVILNEYSKALAEEGIKTADYTKIDAIKKEDGEYVSALSKDENGNDNNLIVSKATFYKLTDKATVFVLIPIRTLTLFEAGKSEFVDKDPIGTAVYDAEKLIPEQCRQIEVNACENQINCEGELSNKCGDIDNDFKFNIDNKINSLERIENNIELNIGSQEIKATHVTSSDVEYGPQDKACDCKISHTETTEVPCPEEELLADPSKICTTTKTVCDEYYRKAAVTCSYSYFGSSKVKVEMIDLNNKYPVYDSTVDMRNVQLNFNVISGNE
ncbi:MAG: hypothetical protein HY361_03720 [Candidatus Aenigmarchaeota archaeon]|nr:hypothetical protein [Candidatus Aenigmarchaeota archaeon]